MGTVTARSLWMELGPMGTVTVRSLWMEVRTHGYSHSEVTVDGG